MVQSIVVDAGVRRSFQPHGSATAAAAEAILPGGFHFQRFQIKLSQYLSWLRIDIMVSSEVTGIVKSKFTLICFAWDLYIHLLKFFSQEL